MTGQFPLSILLQKIEGLTVSKRRLNQHENFGYEFRYPGAFVSRERQQGQAL